MFSIQKNRFEESWTPKPVWLVIKCNSLKKVAFWAKAENAQAIRELWRSILEKVHAHWSTIRWTLRTITKLPFNKSCSCPQFSRLFLSPLISSLCSALCLEADSRLSSLLFALPLRATTSLSVVKVSFAFCHASHLLPLLLLSSSSSKCIFLYLKKKKIIYV